MRTELLPAGLEKSIVGTRNYRREPCGNGHNRKAGNDLMEVRLYFLIGRWTLTLNPGDWSFGSAVLLCFGQAMTIVLCCVSFFRPAASTNQSPMRDRKFCTRSSCFAAFASAPSSDSAGSDVTVQ
ncbi:unnamed protein product [Cercospora beticola]|nr:unnamed protein product [Cercospora beticola]